MKITHQVTAHFSRRDRAGNCYWAFSYVSMRTGFGCSATTSGGESNIRAMILELSHGVWKRNYTCTVVEHSIREFNRMTKGWPHAGCHPKELAAFVRRNARMKENLRQLGELGLLKKD